MNQHQSPLTTPPDNEWLQMREAIEKQTSGSLLAQIKKANAYKPEDIFTNTTSILVADFQLHKAPTKSLYRVYYMPLAAIVAFVLISQFANQLPQRYTTNKGEIVAVMSIEDINPLLIIDLLEENNSYQQALETTPLDGEESTTDYLNYEITSTYDI